MICPNCGKEIGGGLMYRYEHDTFSCSNKKFKPLPKEMSHGKVMADFMERTVKEYVDGISKLADDYIRTSERNFKVMNGDGVYIDDTKGICIIPEKYLKQSESC